AGGGLQTGQVPGQAGQPLLGQRPAAGRIPRRHVDQGRPLELGRVDQATPARAARIPPHLPVGTRRDTGGAMRVLVLLLSLFLAGTVGAQPSTPSTEQNVKDQQERPVTQPGNNAPFYREVRGGPQTPYTTSSAQGRETGVLIQSWGDTWRRIRNGPVTFYGGWLVLLVLAAIAGFYAIFGAVKVHEAPTGRMIPRFSRADQIVHWSVAISFCVLGLSGLIMFFGKHVLLPVIGYTLFGWLAALSKNLHNFIAPVFIVSIIAMIVLYAKDNLPKSYDLKFLLNAVAVMA